MRKLLFTGAVIIFIVAAVTGIFMLLPGESEADVFEVYIAKDSLEPGDEIKESSITTKQVNVKEDWMVENIEDILGMVVVSTINEGRYIDRSNLSQDDSVVFKDGEGEFTIRTKTEYLNGGRIKAGNIVDVILSKRSAGEESIGEIVAEDIVVVSIRTQSGDSFEEKREEGNERIEPYAVTLKTNIEQAERLAAAQENGTLSLFLNVRGETLE